MTASDFMLSPSMKARARPDPTNDVYSLYVLVLVDDEGLAFFYVSIQCVKTTISKTWQTFN